MNLIEVKLADKEDIQYLNFEDDRFARQLAETFAGRDDVEYVLLYRGEMKLQASWGPNGLYGRAAVKQPMPADACTDEVCGPEEAADCEACGCMREPDKPCHQCTRQTGDY